MANNDASEWILFDTDLVTVLGILPASESHLYLVLNEPGSGELKIPIASALANGMTSGMFAQCSYRGEVRGGFFVENMSEGQADASEYSGQWLSISGRGALSLLDDAIVWSGGSTDSTRDFAGMSKAEILITLITEAQARGALLNLSYDFSATLDSRGEAWIDSDTPPLTVGKSLLDVARDFAKAGIDFDITPNAGNFILSAYKEARGSDKSNTVYFRIGLSCKELTSDERVDKIKNALLVAYKSGYISVQDDDSISARRRRERLLDLKAAQTSSSATTIGAAEVALYKDPKQGIVVKVDDGAGPRIFVDYDLGDYIQLDNAGAENRYRILGMQPNWVNGKYSDVALELNSLFNDNDIEMSQDIDWLMEQINTANDAGLLEVSYWAAIGEPVVELVTGLHIIGNKLYFIGTGPSFYSYDIGTGEWIDTPIDIGNNPLCITSVGTDLYIGCFHAVYKYDTITRTLTNIGDVHFSESFVERITAIGAIGTVVYVAGTFETIDGVSADSMAQYDTVGDVWSAWGSGKTGQIDKILTSGADLWVAGSVTNIDGTPVSNVGHWDGMTWDDMGGGLDYTALALALYGTNILAGGGFTGRIAEWDGASWTVFGGGLSGVVTDIAVYLTDVYAVGNFTTEGNYITKYSGGVWWQLRDGVNDVINKIALYNDDVYVAGAFTQADGKDAPRVAVYFTNFESLLDYLDNSGSFNMGAAIHNAPAAALTNASEIPFWDAVTTKLRKITWLNMWLTIKALTDTIYVPSAQTANRILVSNGSGVVTTDAALKFDATTKQLQIGTPNSTSGDYAIIQGNDGASVFHIMEVYGSGATISPFINGIRGEGTAASPTALSADKYMLRLRGSAYDGPGSYGGTSAEVRLVTSENHTPSAHGAMIELYTTPAGSITLTKTLVVGQGGIASNVTTGKMLTLTAVDNYALAIPATGTAGLLEIANLWANVNQITVPTTTTNGLILKTSDNSLTNNLLEVQSSTALKLVKISPAGKISIANTTAAHTGSAYLCVNDNSGASDLLDIRWANTRTLYINNNGHIAVTPTGTLNQIALTIRPSAMSAPGATVTWWGKDEGYIWSGVPAGIKNLFSSRFTSTYSSTLSNNASVYVQDFDIATGAGFTAALLKYTGFRVYTELQGSGTITDLVFFDIGTKVTTKTATVTNAYGMIIRDIDYGTTTNYAIQTSKGLNLFGDQLKVAGWQDVTQIQVTGHTTQTNPVAYLIDNTSATNFIRDVLKLETQSTGTVANGLGAGLLYSIETATSGTLQNAARISAITVDANNPTRKYKLAFSAWDTFERLGMEIEATGSAAQITTWGNTYLGSQTNCVLVDANGKLTLLGTATVHDDLASPLIGSRLESPSSHIVTNNAECTIEFKTSCDLTDYIITTPQITHKWLLGSAIKPHLHWEQTSATMPNWMLQFRWQKQGSAKTTAWTDAAWVSNAFTYSSGTLNQITAFGSITPPVGYGLSDIVDFRIIRDGANGSGLFGGADGLAASVYAKSFDCHVEMDTLGSNDEYAK